MSVLILSGLVAFFIPSLQAQDERSFAKRPKKVKLRAPLKIDERLRVKSRPYEYDLNLDGKKEYIRLVKTASTNTFELFDHRGKKLWAVDLEGFSWEGHIYRIEILRDESIPLTLAISSVEGILRHPHLRKRSRLDLITVNKKTLKRPVHTVGPSIYWESTDKREQYKRRHYKIAWIDMDSDGVRELSVEYFGVKRLYKLRGVKWVYIDPRTKYFGRF